MSIMTGSFRAAWLLAISVLTCVGCASSGDNISDAALSGDPAAMARDGLALNTRGRELLSRGEKRLKEGREQVRDGELMVNSGSESVASLRADYRAAARLGGDANTPRAVSTEAKRLKKLGNDWEEAIERVRDGNELVSKGNKNIERAQSEIREARRMMSKGSALVRNSERARSGETLLSVPD